MKRQYRVIDPDYAHWTIELYHNGKLVATEKFSEADKFDARLNKLEKSGYEQGYLPEEVQQVKDVYEKRLAKVIGSETKRATTEEYIKKEDLQTFSNYCTELAKVEAYEEFANELKKRLGIHNLPNLIVREHIDHLLKEKISEIVGEG